MGSIFKAPKNPAPPPYKLHTEPDFSYEDEQREKEAAEDEKKKFKS